MSITTSDGHVPKRRKLSHSSDETPRTTSGERKNGEPSSGSAQRKNSSSLVTTGGINKSSLLQLQVNDLLESIKPDYDHILRELKPVSEKVIQTINAIPEREALSLSEAEKVLRKKHGIAIPFATHRPHPNVRYKFEYRPPDQIVARGGLTQRLCTKDEMDFEIAVQMPSSLFQEKDYLNHRALHKRAYYLACIAAGLKDSSSKEYDLRYDFQDGNSLIPVILLKPRRNISSTASPNLKMTINVYLPSTTGPLEKMLPSRSCIKSDSEHQTESTTSTPFYNSTIRSLASQANVDGLFEHTIQKCDSFSDACALGQTWLRQRGFGSELSAGGFGLSEWMYMCALLLFGGGHKGHPLFSDRYSSVQLFKAMLQIIANRDLTEPLVVRPTNLHLPKNEIPVLYDGVNGINVLSKVDKWPYKLLRHHAQLTLTAVNARGVDNFEPSFITKVAENSLQFDEVYAIDIKPSRELMAQLYDVLEKGLGDRVSLLDLRGASHASWEAHSSEPKPPTHNQNIGIRLLCNPDAALRLIDHGPTAEDQIAARDFRSFWGEKSELRRFRDGSITETLVWEADKPVTLQIIQYLIMFHFEIPPSSVRCETPDLLKQRLISDIPVSAEDAFKLINNRYQELSSKLHQMEGLPLPIRSVTPAHPALRSATLCHPLDPLTSTPVDIHIQFDSSARWPDHLRAIQYTKIAFLAKISDLVTESDQSVDTRIGLENTDHSHTGYHNTSFLDIISPPPAPGLSSIVLRLRIHHERGLQLLQDLLADKTLQTPTRHLVTAAVTEHKRHFISSPAQTSSIRNLVTQFPPLSSTIRLLKSWIASHNLSNHIPAPVLEIIAAQVFLQPHPWSTPGNATTAFLRCLHFLSKWDWSLSPLIVDLSPSQQDLTSTQLTDLETRFQAWRKLDPNMNTVAWFVGTNIDPTGTIWTQGSAGGSDSPSPPKVIATRVTALARAAIDLIKSSSTATTTTQLLQSDSSKPIWKDLFVSPTSDFDFVMHLKPSIVPGGGGGHQKSDRSKKASVQLKFKNLEVQRDLDTDRIGHDVVSLFLQDLQRAFGNVVLFFHGEGRDIIAGLWRPSLSSSSSSSPGDKKKKKKEKEKEWRVRLGYSSIPYAVSVSVSKEKDGSEKLGDGKGVGSLAEVNWEGILTEIALLGEGMIQKITVKN